MHSVMEQVKYLWASHWIIKINLKCLNRLRHNYYFVSASSEKHVILIRSESWFIFKTKKKKKLVFNLSRTVQALVLSNFLGTAPPTDQENIMCVVMTSWSPDQTKHPSINKKIVILFDTHCCTSWRCSKSLTFCGLFICRFPTFCLFAIFWYIKKKCFALLLKKTLHCLWTKLHKKTEHLTFSLFQKIVIY